MLTAKQLRERKGLMTSSMVSAVFASDPYGGALSAQQIILGQLAEKSEPTPEREAAMLRGNLCEPACLEYARLQLGAAKWKKPKFIAHQNGWSGDSADALFYDKAGNVIAAGEAKTVSAAAADQWGTPGTDEVPDHVILQSYWHMLHHPVDLVAVPVLLGGWSFSFAMYIVERNQPLIDRITAEAHAWHEAHIVQRLPVSPTARDTNAVRALFPVDRVPKMEMTSELEHWAQQKVRWEAARKAAEEREDEAKNHLRVLLGEHGAAISDTVSVTNRAAKASDKTDWRSLAMSLHPDAERLARFTKRVDGSRRLTVTVRDA